MAAVSEESKKKVLKVVLAIVILGVAAGVYYAMSGPSAPPVQEGPPKYTWFYDAGSGELFSMPGGTEGPIEPPSGGKLSNGEPGGVNAYVFSCGSCDNPAERFIGYVEVMPLEVRNRPFELRNPGLSLISEVKEGSKELAWVPAGSNAGGAITQGLMTRCGGGAPKPCLPTEADQAAR